MNPDDEFEELNAQAEELKRLQMFRGQPGSMDPITMTPFTAEDFAGADNGVPPPPPPPGFVPMDDGMEAGAPIPPPPEGFVPMDTAGEAIGKHIKSIPGDYVKMGSNLVRSSTEALPAYIENMQKERSWYDPRAMFSDPRTIPGLLSLIGSAGATALGTAAGGEEKAKELSAKAQAIYDENPINAEKWSGGNLAGAMARGGASMAPALAAGVATKSPLLPMEIIGGQGYLEGYGKQREAGMSPGEAQGPAFGYAAAEALPEALPLGLILKQGVGLLRRTVGGMVGEGVSEAATAAVQLGIDKGTITPDMTLPQALEEVGFQTVVGAGMGAGMGAAAHPFMREGKQPAPEPGAFTQEDVAPEAPLQALPDYSQGAAEKIVTERNKLLDTMDFLQDEGARAAKVGDEAGAKNFAQSMAAYSQEVEALNQKLADFTPVNVKAAEQAQPFVPRSKQTMEGGDAASQRALPDYSQTMPMPDRTPVGQAKAAAQERASLGLTPDVDVAQRMAQRPDMLAAALEATRRPEALPAPEARAALPPPIARDPDTIQAPDLTSKASVREMLDLIRYRQEQQTGPTINAPDANAPATPARIGQEVRPALPAPTAANPDAIPLPDQSTRVAQKALQAQRNAVQPSGETIALPEPAYTNPLAVTSLPKARKQLGLKINATKDDIAAAAKAAGHDAVIFQNTKDTKLVPLNEVAPSADPAPAVKDSLTAGPVAETPPVAEVYDDPNTDFTPAEEAAVPGEAQAEPEAVIPASEEAAEESGAKVNMPDPKTMKPEALYRAQKKIDKAFSDDTKAKPDQRMTDEEYEALEEYARQLEEEIATRGKPAMAEKLKAKKDKVTDEDLLSDKPAESFVDGGMRGLKELLGDESGAVDFSRLFSWVGKTYGKGAVAAMKKAHASFQDNKDLWLHPGKMAKVLFRGNDSVMFGLGKKYPTAQKIAEMFAGKAGTGQTRGESYQEEIQRVAGQFRAAVAKELHGLNLAEREALTPMLQNPSTINGRSPAGRKAQRIRDLIVKHQEYLKQSGINLHEQDGYFPRFYDLEKVTEGAANEAAFLDDATKAYLDTYKDENGQPIISSQEARELGEKWLKNIRSGAEGFNVEDNEFSVMTAGPPSPNNLKSRKLSKAADDIMRNWLIQDPAAALPMMAQSTTRRAAWEKRLGGTVRVKENGKEFDIPKWTNFKDQLRKEGMNSAELHMLVGAVRSSAQIMPDALHPSSTWFLGALRTYSALEFLNKVAWASLQETVMPMVRTGRPVDAINGITGVMQHLLRNKMNLTKAQQASQIAEWSALTGEAVEDMLMQSMTGATGTLKRFEQTYIRGTLIPQLTMAQRTSTTRIGMKHVARMAKEIVDRGKQARIARYELRELGIDEAKMPAFAKWVNDNASGIDVDFLEKADPTLKDAYVRALHLFVDQTVMNPKASERQRYANAPGLVAFPYYLTSFIQSFQKNVLDRLFRMSKAGVTGKLAGENLKFAERAQMLAPAACMVLLTGIAMGLREVREKLMYKDPVARDKDWFGKALTYASAAGLLGGLDPYVNMFNSVARYNKDPVSAFSGPLIGKAASSIGSYVMSFDPEHNSKNTNTAERKNARNFYDMVVMPVLMAGTTMVPNDIARYGAIYLAGHPATKEAYTAAVAGDPPKKKGRAARAGGRQHSETLLSPQSKQYASLIDEGNTQELAAALPEMKKDDVINAVLAMDMPELERMVFKTAAPNSRAGRALSLTEVG